MKKQIVTLTLAFMATQCFGLGERLATNLGTKIINMLSWSTAVGTPLYFNKDRIIKTDTPKDALEKIKNKELPFRFVSQPTTVSHCVALPIMSHLAIRALASQNFAATPFGKLACAGLSAAVSSHMLKGYFERK